MGNSIIDEKRQGLLLKTGGGIGTRTNCIGQPGWLIRDCDTFDVISPAKPDVDAHLPKEGATTGNNAGHTISMGKLLSHVKDEYERTNPKSGLKTWL